ncbi:Alanine racemase [Marinomonas spartinae]|uniref:Alanine racemase n=1 Tax=Marinomonas spartinae TaxID=1792290 RepID=A0A1A8TWL3_9GAMM|nr:alanine racemase [Marinomonas spartinae]SBS37949.1 Alanine racemase [Marinomonas spartinae]
MARPLTATIDLEAILYNYRYAKKLQPTCKAFAVVKSNAYGHGAIEVSRYLDDEVDAFAVAAIEEAMSLREAGVKSPILLLEGVFEEDEWHLCEKHGFWSALENAQQLEALTHSKVSIEKVFLKLDSGMHRLGVDKDTAPPFVTALKNSGQVGEVVLMTHFACADDLSDSATLDQLAYFERTRQSLGEPIEASVANSAAIMKWQVPEGGWIRPGIMLYGISPFSEVSGRSIGLRPAMTLSSKVISTRSLRKGDHVGYGLGYVAPEDHVLATVAVGYGDGYPRHAENGTPLQIKGHLASLAGRVSMDMITVRTEEGDVPQMGDEVVLWGGEVPVEDVARHAGTIGYELVTRMTARPHYRYLFGEENA